MVNTYSLSNRAGKHHRLLQPFPKFLVDLFFPASHALACVAETMRSYLKRLLFGAFKGKVGSMVG